MGAARCKVVAKKDVQDFVDAYVIESQPLIREDTFQSLWGEKDPKRRFNRSVTTAMDADMFQAIADLAVNPNLPWNGHVAEMGRHAWAAYISSVDHFLSKDTKTLWSALQRIQRRISAEMYAVTAEEQVKEALEILTVWTQSAEWSAVLDDMQFMVDAISDLPSAAWRRRIAREWSTHPQFHTLIREWEEAMRTEASETWVVVKKAIEQLQEMAEQ